MSQPALPEPAPEAHPALHAEPGPPTLTVHLSQVPPGVSVGWASLDGKQLGLLNPVYEAGYWQGQVPPLELQLFVDGLRENESHEGHGTIDMRNGLSAELTIALDQPRKLVTRQVVVRDRRGKAIPQVSGEPVLDGTPAAVRLGVMNYQQWVSDEQGQLTVRSHEGETVQLALTLPLMEQPSLYTLAPGANEIVLRDVTLVRCAFRCPETNKPVGYPGLLAVAELKDGRELRYEQPESDALRSDVAVLTWPQGTRKLTVYSSPFKQAELRSPNARCELNPLPARRCENW